MAASDVAKLPVTLCIGTRNATELLSACIQSCHAWVSEIIVVDMGSTDGTVELAEGFGARVISVPPAGFVEPGRQVGIDAGTQPWMLVLDADEAAAPGLHAVVREAIASSDLSGVWLPRKNFLFGRWTPHGGAWPDYQMRLFRPSAVTWPPRVHALPHVEGRTTRAVADPNSSIIHQNYPNVAAWSAAQGRYSSIAARSRAEAGEQPSVRRLVSSSARSFLRSYLKAKGYRSGTYGLAVALLWAIHEAEVEIKLWELRGWPRRTGKSA